jgi:hypothetical protein
MISASTTTTSSHGANSSFHDDIPAEWDYYPPEYVVIPWEAHGPGILTIKLSLWSLAMMAANGDRCIGYSYPR